MGVPLTIRDRKRARLQAATLRSHMRRTSIAQACGSYARSSANATCTPRADAAAACCGDSSTPLTVGISCRCSLSRSPKNTPSSGLFDVAVPFKAKSFVKKRGAPHGGEKYDHTWSYFFTIPQPVWSITVKFCTGAQARRDGGLAPGMATPCLGPTGVLYRGGVWGASPSGVRGGAPRRKFSVFEAENGRFPFPKHPPKHLPLMSTHESSPRKEAKKPRSAIGLPPGLPSS